METWKFYGRRTELQQLTEILRRQRWFFSKITGRRRIGKTSLIQEALRTQKERPVLYVQIPDSSPAGVLAAVHEALDTFDFDSGMAPRPRTLADFARLIGSLARKDVIVALDEFQYFARERIADFCSQLQAEVDELNRDAAHVPGGLFVLGSIQTELNKLLDDRSAPLFSRVTDEVHLSHLDIETLCSMLRDHGALDPFRLLFLWTLFEGVPKFYRDCFEQGLLGVERKDALRRLFFESSSPLRTEADNWFLKELHGRYDAILKYIARNPGGSHGDIVAHVRSMSDQTDEQVGGYLRVLVEKYQLVEKQLPIFAKPNARSGRYYITDNFLRAWLGALAPSVAAINFSPIEDLVVRADTQLMTIEEQSFEKLVGILYEERSRKRRGDMALTERIHGFWDRGGIEIDLVALDENSRRIRFGSCKRSEEKLLSDAANFDAHIDRFLALHPEYSQWIIERVMITPVLSRAARARIESDGRIAQDLTQLLDGF